MIYQRKCQLFEVVMKIYNYDFEIETRGFTDIVNISGKVFEQINKCSITNGSVLVFSPGSTSGITTIEYESGCVADLKRFFESIAPSSLDYSHNMKWGDGNGFSHIRSAITKTGFVFPVIDGRPALGTWQQIVFIDFDNSARRRRIIVQVTGE